MTQNLDWDFADANTQRHVHGIHPYPARMIPQIANRLICQWSKPNDIVLDPFCGSGTVLVESLLENRNSIGVDINKLALLLSNVKTTRINPERLNEKVIPVLNSINEKIKKYRSGNYEVKTTIFKNIFHWFKKNVVNELSIIQNEIYELKDEDEDIFKFLQVCFSSIIRKTSNIDFDDNPYFIRAKSGTDLDNFNPDVLKSTNEIILGSINRVNQFYILCPESVKCSIHEVDSRKLPFDDNSINLLVTSPPYGEESHTMSYTRFAKLSLLWLGISEYDIKNIESKSLGGKIIRYRNINPEIDNLLKTIKIKNEERSNEVFSFIYDYKKCLDEFYRVLCSGSYMCIVIGDRTASGIEVSNENITKKLCKNIGFKREITYYRKIPHKVLPRSDYKVELINNESIIVLKKP